MNIPFSNKYAHRTAASESTCFVCGKFTSAVLTHKDIDWFYVCPSHIKDTSFCKPVNPPPTTPSQMQQVKPQISASVPNKNKNKEKSDKVETEVEKANDKAPIPDETPKIPQPIVKTGPIEYYLDSKIFYLRENQYRQKQANKRAKQVASQFPSVPL